MANLANSYIKFFLENEYRSQLDKTDSLDRDAIQGKKLLPYEDHKNMNGLMDFSINELKLTANEIVQYATNSGMSYIVTLLYSTFKQNNNRRDEWIEFFKPALIKNSQFFKECIQKCLETHLYNKTTNAIPEEHKLLYIKKNEEIFKDLVKIGKEYKLFNNLSHENLYSSNQDYQDYLIKEKVFNSTFSLKELKKILEKNKNKECIQEQKNYISVHLNEIIDQFNINPNFISEIEIWDIEETISQNKYLETFIKLLTGNAYEIEQEKYEEFLLSLTMLPAVKNKLLNEIDLSDILKNYPLIFEKTIEQLNENQANKFFNTDILNYTNDKKKAVGLIKSFAYENNYSIKMIDYLYKELLKTLEQKKYTEENERQQSIKTMQEIMSVSLLQNIEASIKTNSIKHIEAILKKFTNVIGEGFYLETQFTNSKVFATSLHEICKDEKIDNDLKKKLLHRVATHVQSQLYQYFIKNTESTITGSNHFIVNLQNYLKTTKNYTVLDVLNVNSDDPLWKKLTVTTINTKKSKVNNADYPFAFYMIEKTNGEMLNWLIEDNNKTINLNLVMYENKGLIHHFSKHEDLKKYIEILKNDIDAFKLLIVKNKKALNAVSKLEDISISHYLNTIILYNEINDKVIPKKEELVKPKKKI